MKFMGAALTVLLVALTACSALRPDGEAATPAAAAAVTVPKSLPAPPPPPPAPSPSPAAAVPAETQTAASGPAAATTAAPASASPPAQAISARSKVPSASTPPRPAPAVQASAPAAKQTIVSPPVERSATTAPLDIAALEQRLRETHAIGVFTKLSLKNQVDDLLAQFRAHFGGSGTPPLSGLRERYDLLMMKVLSLLQDKDPALAQTIGSSREAIWGILSDPAKLKAIS